MTLRDARPPYPEEAGAKRVRKKKEDRDREEGKRRNMSAGRRARSSPAGVIGK